VPSVTAGGGTGGPEPVTVPLGIVVVAFALGALVPAMRLPEIGPTGIDRLALAVVCVLLGMALGVLALDAYTTVKAVDGDSPFTSAGDAEAYIVAQGIAAALRDAGPLLGLAAVVYLLAGMQARRRAA